MENGANAGLRAPAITAADANAVQGTASPLVAYVQIYSDESNEGETSPGKRL